MLGRYVGIEGNCSLVLLEVCSLDMNQSDVLL
jgi:hypothetical protein